MIRKGQDRWVAKGDTVGQVALLTFENGDLLSEREHFQSQIARTAKEDADCVNEGEDEFQYDLIPVTWHQRVCC
jgi:hypothetical protein